jgi:hypothetical protein
MTELRGEAPPEPRSGDGGFDPNTHYRDVARSVVAGRRILVVSGPVAGLTAFAAGLRALGAERPFVLGHGIGTGDLPAPEDAGWFALETAPGGARPADMIEGMRRYEALLRDPPAEARAAVDAWDPDRSAVAFGLILLTDPPGVGGRPLYGAREPAWRALEDKVAIDDFWDAIGVERAPSAVVAAEPRALRAAAKRLDGGDGTAWAGDAREGTHGGAVYLRRVRTRGDADAAAAFFAAHCDRVRVTPFLEGIPCSIHGIVFPDGNAVFRPVEMVTLRPRSGNRLLYAGMSTFWDPPGSDREAMRALARRTAEALRERVGYRGAFTVDGVMTREGFRPTELNARAGAGLRLLAAACPGIPLFVIALAAQAGERLDYRPERLERAVVERADRRRFGSGQTVVRRVFSESRTLRLVEEGDGFREAPEGEEADATLIRGPSDVGGFVRYAPEPGRIEAGGSLAPRVACALAFADDRFDLGLGPLEPPNDVRRR